MQSQLLEDLMDTVRIVTGKLKIEVRPVSLTHTLGMRRQVVSSPCKGGEGISKWGLASQTI
jgi:hypothetical protein